MELDRTKDYYSLALSEALDDTMLPSDQALHRVCDTARVIHLGTWSGPAVSLSMLSVLLQPDVEACYILSSLYFKCNWCGSALCVVCCTRVITSRAPAASSSGPGQSTYPITGIQQVENQSAQQPSKPLLNHPKHNAPTSTPQWKAMTASSTTTFKHWSRASLHDQITIGIVAPLPVKHCS
jgi:hypothetical protein